MTRFFGLLLMTIGTMCIVLSGLCSALFAISFLQNGQQSDLSAVVIVGVPSVVTGAVIYAVGRWLRPK
ncbi:MAG: hypothetical protein ABL973_06245 [Micropepsaceae bacterium]